MQTLVLAKKVCDENRKKDKNDERFIQVVMYKEVSAEHSY